MINNAQWLLFITISDDNQHQPFKKIDPEDLREPPVENNRGQYQPFQPIEDYQPAEVTEEAPPEAAVQDADTFEPADANGQPLGPPGPNPDEIEEAQLEEAAFVPSLPPSAINNGPEPENTATKRRTLLWVVLIAALVFIVGLLLLSGSSDSEPESSNPVLVEPGIEQQKIDKQAKPSPTEIANSPAAAESQINAVRALLESGRLAATSSGKELAAELSQQLGFKVVNSADAQPRRAVAINIVKSSIVLVLPPRAVEKEVLQELAYPQWKN